jgi:hypothetical protein
MMNKIYAGVLIVSFLALLSCEKQDKVFDLQKIDAHQRLNNVLQDIDQQIESIKIDTLQLAEGDLEEKLAQSEQELTEMRDMVLKHISMVDSIAKDNWQDFEASMDSTEIDVEKKIQEVQDYISTMVQKTPPVPPLY